MINRNLRLPIEKASDEQDAEALVEMLEKKLEEAKESLKMQMHKKQRVK